MIIFSFPMLCESTNTTVLIASCYPMVQSSVSPLFRSMERPAQAALVKASMNQNAIGLGEPLRQETTMTTLNPTNSDQGRRMF